MTHGSVRLAGTGYRLRVAKSAHAGKRCITRCRLAAKSAGTTPVEDAMNAYEDHLDRNAANYAALTPLSFIARTAHIWPHRVAVIHGERRYTWAATYARSRRLASALAKRGFGKGDTIAAMLANTPEMIEAHFGVPMMGGVLNTLNTRLDAEAIAFMLAHGEAKVVLTDTEFAPIVAKALASLHSRPLVIDIVDFSGP